MTTYYSSAWTGIVTPEEIDHRAYMEALDMAVKFVVDQMFKDGLIGNPFGASPFISDWSSFYDGGPFQIDPDHV